MLLLSLLRVTGPHTNTFRTRDVNAKEGKTETQETVCRGETYTTSMRIREQMY